MKHTCFWLCALLSVGCSQSDEIRTSHAPPASQMHESTIPTSPIRDCLSRQLQNGALSYRVSQREAMILADILDENDNDYEIEYLIYESDTLIYVLNSSNGWKLLSTDKRMQPILAYSDSGTFSIDSLNPGEAIWLDELAEELYEMAHDEEAVESEEEYIEEADPAWVNLAPAMAPANTYDEGEWVRERTKTYTTLREVGPLTQTQWGQKHPWNQCCPFGSSTERAAAGCVAIAGAQMLYHLHYLWNVPAAMYMKGSCSGTLNNYKIEVSELSPDAWDLMAKTIRDTTEKGYLCSSILIGLTGNSIGMKYGLKKSSANTEDLKGFFKKFGIRSTYSNYSSSKVFESLDKEIPVIVRANGARTNRLFGLIYSYENGHAWIIDGYRKDEKITEISYRWHTYYTTPDDAERDWEVPPPGEKDWEDAVDDGELEEKEEDGASSAARPMRSNYRPIFPTSRTYTKTITTVTGKYVHMNWGWAGSSNTWYATSDPWETQGSNFEWKRKMLIINSHD